MKSGPGNYNPDLTPRLWTIRFTIVQWQNERFSDQKKKVKSQFRKWYCGARSVSIKSTAAVQIKILSQRSEYQSMREVDKCKELVS